MSQTYVRQLPAYRLHFGTNVDEFLHASPAGSANSLFHARGRTAWRDAVVAFCTARRVGLVLLAICFVLTISATLVHAPLLGTAVVMLAIVAGALITSGN